VRDGGGGESSDAKLTQKKRDDKQANSKYNSQEIVDSMARALAAKMKAAEPERFEQPAEELVSSLALPETCMRIVLHYRKVVCVCVSVCLCDCVSVSLGMRET